MFMKSIAELEAIRQKTLGQVNLRREHEGATHVFVGMGTCGIAAGAREIMTTIVDEIGAANVTNIKVVMGPCDNAENAPVVEIHEADKEVVTFTKVDAAKAKQIVADIVGKTK